MAFCVAADVQTLIVQVTFSGSTTPTLTTVGTWIDQITEEMNGILVTADYPADITATASAKILNRICAHAVAAMAINASQFASEPAASEQGATYWKVYEDGLNRIMNLPNYLHDAAGTGVGGGVRPRSFATDNPDDALDPSFTREMDF